MTCCPLCNLPMQRIGRLVEQRDPQGFYFVFALCQPCRTRLDRLPATLQKKQHSIAIARLARHPERHDYRSFASCAEARLYRVLEAERLEQQHA